VSTVYLSGGYKSPYSAKRVLRGVALGTVLIAAVYGLLPNHLRFSRALIILGAGWAVISMLGWRILAHYRKYGNVNLGSRAELSTAVVGNASERSRVSNMLKRFGPHVNLIGFISPSESENDEVLGSLNRLDEICQVYGIEEVIFCAKDVASSDIMYWMTTLQNKGLHFKILPEERYFVIGSNSKNTTGEFYTEEIGFSLSDGYALRKKRIFDLVASIILIPLGVFIAPLSGAYSSFYGNCFSILFNRKTWVTYDNSVSTEQLPPIKPGAFFVTSHLKLEALNDRMREKLNFLYARNYNLEMDFSILMKVLFRRKN